MGYSLSWIAVRGKTTEVVERELRLVPTGATEDIPASPVVGASLNGWTIVIANDDDRFVIEELLVEIFRHDEDCDPPLVFTVLEEVSSDGIE